MDSKEDNQVPGSTGRHCVAIPCSQLTGHHSLGVKSVPVAIALKRVYDMPQAADGMRILVDRLWPRGLSKQTADIDLWLRDLAPSDELRHWFHQRPQHWAVFRKRYLAELGSPQAADAVEQLYGAARKRKHITLLFASKNVEHNNAIVLKELLEGMRKPPSTSGPAGAPARSRARIARPKST